MSPVMTRIPSPLGKLLPGCLSVAAGLAVALAGVPVRGEVEVDGTLVRVSKADCLRLVKHRPEPGVIYQPGVDVRGNAVAPAELYDRPAIELPERIEIPIEVDLDRRYGLPADDSFKADAQVGTVTVDLETGRASFNGQPLTSDDAAELRARCQQVLSGEGSAAPGSE
jgi:hypothetical protein